MQVEIASPVSPLALPRRRNSSSRGNSVSSVATITLPQTW